MNTSSPTTDPLDTRSPIPTLSPEAIARRDAGLGALREEVLVSGRARVRRRRAIRAGVIAALLAIAVGIPAAALRTAPALPAQAIDMGSVADEPGLADSQSVSPAPVIEAQPQIASRIAPLLADGSGIARSSKAVVAETPAIRSLTVGDRLVQRVDDDTFIAEASAGGRDIGIARVGDSVRVIADAGTDATGT